MNPPQQPMIFPPLAFDPNVQTPPGVIASFINSDRHRTPYTPLDPNNLMPGKKSKKILTFTTKLKFNIIYLILVKPLFINKEELESDFSKFLSDTKDLM